MSQEIFWTIATLSRNLPVIAASHSSYGATRRCRRDWINVPSVQITPPPLRPAQAAALKERTSDVATRSKGDSWRISMPCWVESSNGVPVLTAASAVLLELDGNEYVFVCAQPVAKALPGHPLFQQKLEEVSNITAHLMSNQPENVLNVFRHEIGRFNNQDYPKFTSLLSWPATTTWDPKMPTLTLQEVDMNRKRSPSEPPMRTNGFEVNSNDGPRTGIAQKKANIKRRDAYRAKVHTHREIVESYFSGAVANLSSTTSSHEITSSTQSNHSTPVTSTKSESTQCESTSES